MQEANRTFLIGKDGPGISSSESCRYFTVSDESPNLFSFPMRAGMVETRWSAALVVRWSVHTFATDAVSRLRATIIVFVISAVKSQVASESTVVVGSQVQVVNFASVRKSEILNSLFEFEIGVKASEATTDDSQMIPRKKTKTFSEPSSSQIAAGSRKAIFIIYSRT
eukprot:scaffold1222_cov260-Chaetoceros_neogracile.AAC.62